jgi:hypothetical protein
LVKDGRLGDATILRRALESYGHQGIESVPKAALKYLILHRFGSIHPYLENAEPGRAR